MSNLKSESINTTLETALLVLEHGWANIDQLRHANNWRLAQCPRFGKLAHNSRKLSMNQIHAVLEEQRIHGKLFGETAVDLGFMNTNDVYELLRLQSEFTPCLVDALFRLAMISREQAAFVSNAIYDSEVSLEAEWTTSETTSETVLS